MLSLSLEVAVVVGFLLLVGGAVVGQAEATRALFAAAAERYQSSALAKAVYGVPLVGPAVGEMLDAVDTADEDGDAAVFRQLWGFDGDDVLVVLPTDGETRVATDGGGVPGDAVDVTATTFPDDRLTDGDTYDVLVTPHTVDRAADPDRLHLYYDDADGQARNVTVWADRSDLADAPFEAGETYLLSAVRYEFRKGRFHDLWATPETRAAVVSDRESGVPCPVLGCDYGGEPRSVAGHVSGVHGWDDLPLADTRALLATHEDDESDGDPDTEPTVGCPVDGCDYEGEPRSVTAHVNGKRDDEHTWDRLPYENSAAFVSAARAGDLVDRRDREDDAGGAGDTEGDDDYRRVRTRAPTYRCVEAALHVLLELPPLYDDADVDFVTDEEFRRLSGRQRARHVVLLGTCEDDYLDRWLDNPHFGFDEDRALADRSSGARYPAPGAGDDDYGLFVKKANPDDPSRELVVVAGLTERSALSAARAYLPQGGVGGGGVNCLMALNQLSDRPRERVGNPRFATAFRVEAGEGDGFVPEPTDVRRL